MSFFAIAETIARKHHEKWIFPKKYSDRPLVTEEIKITIEPLTPFDFNQENDDETPEVCRSSEGLNAPLICVQPFAESFERSVEEEMGGLVTGSIKRSLSCHEVSAKFELSQQEERKSTQVKRTALSKRGIKFRFPDG